MCHACFISITSKFQCVPKTACTHSLWGLWSLFSTYLFTSCTVSAFVLVWPHSGGALRYSIYFPTMHLCLISNAPSLAIPFTRFFTCGVLVCIRSHSILVHNLCTFALHALMVHALSHGWVCCLFFPAIIHILVFV